MLLNVHEFGLGTMEAEMSGFLLGFNLDVRWLGLVTGGCTNQVSQVGRTLLSIRCNQSAHTLLILVFLDGDLLHLEFQRHYLG